MDLSDPKYASLKRLVAMLLGLAVVGLNKKLGLGLDTGDVTALTTLVLGYIATSNWKEQAMAKAAAAANTASASVTTTTEAVKVINGSGVGGGAGDVAKALLFLFLFAPLAARAQAPDAPLTFAPVALDKGVTLTSSDAKTVDKGDPAPADGCFLPSQLCTTTGKRIASCEAERDSLKADIAKSPSPLLFLAGGLLLGLGAGFAAAMYLPDRK